jgi:hypothetical protein
MRLGSFCHGGARFTARGVSPVVLAGLAAHGRTLKGKSFSTHQSAWMEADKALEETGSSRCGLSGQLIYANACAPCLAAVALLDKVIDQFARGVVHLHIEGFHLACEVVEGQHGGDGDKQSESRGHQGL